MVRAPPAVFRHELYVLFPVMLTVPVTAILIVGQVNPPPVKVILPDTEVMFITPVPGVLTIPEPLALTGVLLSSVQLLEPNMTPLAAVPVDVSLPIVTLYPAESKFPAVTIIIDPEAPVNASPSLHVLPAALTVGRLELVSIFPFVVRVYVSPEYPDKVMAIVELMVIPAESNRLPRQVMVLPEVVPENPVKSSPPFMVVPAALMYVSVPAVTYKFNLFVAAAPVVVPPIVRVPVPPEYSRSILLVSLTASPVKFVKVTIVVLLPYIKILPPPNVRALVDVPVSDN
jgi:hypothetical protein